MQLKLADAKKAVADLKKICSDEKLLIELMLYYVEMGVEFTNAYGDINDSFYSSMESMYQSAVNLLNKHKNPKIFEAFRDRLKAVVDDTGHIGWGFHDTLGDKYSEIKWLDIGDFDIDEDELKHIKEYIVSRLGKRNDIPDFGTNMSIDEVVSAIIDADELFLSKMDAQGGAFSNDDEYDYISDRTGYSFQLVEFILWQRYCYEMENDYWAYDAGKCSKCGNTELYLKEVPGEDFEDKVMCNMCGTEYIRE